MDPQKWLKAYVSAISLDLRSLLAKEYIDSLDLNQR